MRFLIIDSGLVSTSHGFVGHTERIDKKRIFQPNLPFRYYSILSPTTTTANHKRGWGMNRNSIRLLREKK